MPRIDVEAIPETNATGYPRRMTQPSPDAGIAVSRRRQG